MVGATAPSNLHPPRENAVSESYAVYVGDDWIHVWQFRASLSEPDGEWQYAERLDRDNDPRLSLEYATLTSPDGDGYWVYSKSYDCTLDCE